MGMARVCASASAGGAEICAADMRICISWSCMKSVQLMCASALAEAEICASASAGAA